MPNSPKQAIILAAGQAQRLRPLTARRPKGMLLVGSKPLLQHLVETLKATGVQDVVFVVGHAGEKIQSFFKDGKDFGVNARYAHQLSPTGTADACRMALAQTDAQKQTLILPGDNYLSRNSLEALLSRPKDALLLAQPKRATQYGIPTIRGDQLVALRDGPVSPGSTRVSTGVIKAGTDLLGHLAQPSREAVHDLDQVLDGYVKNGGKVQVADVQGLWEDVTDAWDVLALNEHVLNELLPAGGANESRVQIGANTVIAPTANIVGPVTIGEGSYVGDYTVVGPYVSVRNNTTIGSHVEIRRSILNNNVTVDSRCLVRGSILDDGVRLGSGFVCHEASTPRGLVGCVIGADAEVGPDCRVGSGAMVEPETNVPAGSRIGG